MNGERVGTIRDQLSITVGLTVLYAAIAIISASVAGSATLPEIPFFGVIVIAVFFLFATSVSVYASFNSKPQSILKAAYITLSWYSTVIILLLLPISFNTVLVGSILTTVIPISLYIHPEWYTISFATIVTAVGSIAFISSFVPLSGIVAGLLILIVYDIIAVSATGKLNELVDSLVENGAPALIYLPLTASFSLDNDSGTVFTIGVADIVVPTTLVSVVAVTISPLVGGISFIGLIIGIVSIVRTSFNTSTWNPGLPALNVYTLLAFGFGMVLFF